MPRLKEFSERIQTANQDLKELSGDERARREDLVEKARRDLLVVEDRMSKGKSHLEAEERLLGILNDLENTDES
jgi:hypothetical protein